MFSINVSICNDYSLNLELETPPFVTILIGKFAIPCVAGKNNLTERLNFTWIFHYYLHSLEPERVQVHRQSVIDGRHFHNHPKWWGQGEVMRALLMLERNIKWRKIEMM